MTDTTHYVIRGGVEGRERLRVLSRVMSPSTKALLDRVGVTAGQSCLDVGCGGGDVTLELARRVGPRGRVLGVDIDDAKLRIARDEAAQQQLLHVEFRLADIRVAALSPPFDLVYARFLLTHLSDPASAVSALVAHVRLGGVVVVEDIDYSAYFVHPHSRAFDRYVELYCATVSRRGGDPNIGLRLPSLLMQAGLRDVDAAAAQPIGTRGEAKLMNALTMENIADAVLVDSLATREEIDRLVRELYDYAADPTTVAGTPRVVQAWGRR